MRVRIAKSVRSTEAVQGNEAPTPGRGARATALSLLRLLCAAIVLAGVAPLARAADLTGKWNGTNHTITVSCEVPPESTGPAELELTQTGDTFTGTYLFSFENPETCIPATELSYYLLDFNGTVTGNTFTADVSFPGDAPFGTLTGQVTGNAMSFTWIWPTDEEHDAYPEEPIDSIITAQLTRLPPGGTPSAAVDTLWPPNSKMVDIGLSLGDATFTVYSDEDDGRNADASGSLLLRAQRAGTGDGRVYLILITSATTQTCLTVVVPKSQSPSDLAAVQAQATAALAQCPVVPAGYFVIER